MDLDAPGYHRCGGVPSVGGSHGATVAPDPSQCVLCRRVQCQRVQCQPEACRAVPQGRQVLLRIGWAGLSCWSTRLARAVTVAIVTAVVLAAMPVSAQHLRVTSRADAGPGTLRAAILAANAAQVPTRIEVVLPAGSVIEVASALPALRNPGAQLDGAGVTLREKAGCMRPNGRGGCDGLVVSGPNIGVRDLRAQGFLFDGIAVRGRAARDVVIEDCSCFDNRDDGIGVSHHASGVVVRDCVVMDNGFRTKGKGILVFDSASALLERNVVLANRDGVTVSSNSSVRMDGNLIVANFDKGLGVAGAKLEGSGNSIVANGTGDDGAPNGDGLRVTLGSEVTLRGSAVDGNGDVGVIGLGTSSLRLQGGRVVGNGRWGVAADDTATVVLEDVRVAGNAQGPVHRLSAGATLSRR